MKKLFFFLIALGCVTLANAGSIRLINDSVYPLKAMIYANDETMVDEIVIQPFSTKYWSDLQGEEGYRGEQGYTEGDRGLNQNRKYSRTPYRVVWLCMAGTEFSICNDVHTAATVRARDCYGGQLCKPLEEPSPPQ